MNGTIAFSSNTIRGQLEQELKIYFEGTHVCDSCLYQLGSHFSLLEKTTKRNHASNSI